MSHAPKEEREYIKKDFGFILHLEQEIIRRLSKKSILNQACMPRGQEAARVNSHNTWRENGTFSAIESGQIQSFNANGIVLSIRVYLHKVDLDFD